MTDDLPVMKARSAIAKCEVCGVKLYYGSTCSDPAHAGRDCPLTGDEWQELMRIRGMQNARPTL